MNGSQTGWGSSYRNPKFLERFRSPESSKSQGSWWSSPFQKGKEKTVGYCWLRLTLSDEAQRSGFPHWNAAIWDVPRHFCNLILPFVGVSKTLLYPGSPRPSKKVVAHFWMIKIWFFKKKQSTWWNPTTFNGLLTSRAYLASYFTIQRWVQTHSWTSFIKISKKGMAIHRIWFSELRFMPCPAFFWVGNRSKTCGASAWNLQLNKNPGLWWRYFFEDDSGTFQPVEQWKKGPWLVRLFWGIILPNYIGIIINHYKDPY